MKELSLGIEIGMLIGRLILYLLKSVKGNQPPRKK
jgi:hypothetical protein